MELDRQGVLPLREQMHEKLLDHLEDPSPPGGVWDTKLSLCRIVPVTPEEEREYGQEREETEDFIREWFGYIGEIYLRSFDIELQMRMKALQNFTPLEVRGIAYNMLRSIVFPFYLLSKRKISSYYFRLLRNKIREVNALCRAEGIEREEIEIPQWRPFWNMRLFLFKREVWRQDLSPSSQSK